MDIIKFRPSKDADEKALEEAENKQQDQRLAEEFRATAKELEARALARQPQTELPRRTPGNAGSDACANSCGS